MKRMPFRKRLAAMAAEYGPIACWPWPGYIHRNGYATVFGGRDAGGRKLKTMAHRRAYETLVAAIPAGLVIDHLCRNRSCVNPAHLRATSQLANIHSGEGNATKTHCARGHALSGENCIMRKNQLGGPARICRTCNNRWHREHRGKNKDYYRAYDAKRKQRNTLLARERRQRRRALAQSVSPQT